ncbi:hydroxymethylglutaryl-CoA lyase [bacterium]|nr:hydroxymethylglutaryl-CoA lyase [bacterium]
MSEIIIHDVGLRDGLQNEKIIVPFEKKIEFLKLLIQSGIEYIQVGSFVNPKVLPQMADTDEIFAYIKEHNMKPSNVVFTALILNEKGMERAFAANVDRIMMGVSASETHSKKNTNMGVAEATQRIISIAKECQNAGYQIQASVQSAFGCGFEGRVPEEHVLSILDKYFNAGIDNISFADTAGHATPKQIISLFTKAKIMNPSVTIAAHFHNTYGLGMLNIQTAIECGAKYIETAFGGLGGCPFTKVAAGNVATEDVVHYLQRAGIIKGIDLQKLIELAKNVSEFLNKPLPGYVYKTGPINWN